MKKYRTIINTDDKRFQNFMIITETPDIDVVLKEATQIAYENDIDIDEIKQPEKYFQLNSELELKFVIELKDAYFEGSATEVGSCSINKNVEGEPETVERLIEYKNKLYILSISNDEDIAFLVDEKAYDNFTEY